MVEYRSKVVAIFNQKGGVGKTTVASILAEYAALTEGKEVLLVDLDMQCNSSEHWVGMEDAPNSLGGQLPPVHPDYGGEEHLDERSTIADIFFGKAVLPYSTFINSEHGYDTDVDIMMGHPGLLERINTEYDNASGRIVTEIHNRLGVFLHSDEVADTYDLIILDTGPSRNPIFRAALRAATHAIIPFELEENSLQGINAMHQAIQSENFARAGEDSQLNLVGMCPNKVRASTRLHRLTIESLHESLGDSMYPKDVFLPLSTAFPERNVKGVSPKSIFHIKESHAARKASNDVCAYAMAKIFA